MKPARQIDRRSGLTAIEVLIVVVTLCLLVLLLLPRGGTNSISKAPLTACASQLKQLALAEIVWANDHDATNIFLAQRSTNAGGFRELLSPGSLPHFYRALSN